MVGTSPIVNDGIRIIRRRLKDTTKLERYVRKYDHYVTAKGEEVSLYETKGKSGLGIYVKINTPADGQPAKTRIIKFESPDGLALNSYPTEIRESVNGEVTRRLSKNEHGSWVDKNGQPYMLYSHEEPNWSDIPV